MVHFVFTEQDTRFVYLKADFKEEEYIWYTERGAKKPTRFHIFDWLIKKINLIDPLCFRPTFKGIPYTVDFIYEYVQPGGNKILYAPLGLTQDIYNILKSVNVPFGGMDSSFFKHRLFHTLDEFSQIIDEWGLSLDLRPYQIESAYKILQRYKSLSQLATRAGKTLISYCIFRYAMTYMGVKNILMIVPAVDLVKQAYNDFKNYAEFFQTECIWAKGEMVESSNLTVGTFQSLIKFLDKNDKKYNPSFFNKFDCVFVDEVHRATAAQIKEIITQPFMAKAKLVFGMTGTLPKEYTIEHYCLHALLGAKIQEIKPRELMDEGYISDVEITQYRLNYRDIRKQKELYIKCAEYALAGFVEIDDPKHPGKKKRVKRANPEFLLQYEKEPAVGLEEVKESIYSPDNKKDDGSPKSELEKEMEYIDELKKLVAASVGTNSLVIEKMMVHFMTERIDFLCNEILPNCKYNTLILAHHTEYINYLVKYLTEKCPDKIVCVITGTTSDKKRDKIKETLKENNNCILVASYGCVGTGITLANLCYGVLFESFKSEIINMQSIGRGLGLSPLKDKYILYDFIDCFNYTCSTRSIYRQGVEKVHIYEENKYSYKIVDKTL